MAYSLPGGGGEEEDSRKRREGERGDSPKSLIPLAPCKAQQGVKAREP